MQPWSAFGFLGTWASVPYRRLKRPVPLLPYLLQESSDGLESVVDGGTEAELPAFPISKGNTKAGG